MYSILYTLLALLALCIAFAAVWYRRIMKQKKELEEQERMEYNINPRVIRGIHDKPPLFVLCPQQTNQMWWNSFYERNTHHIPNISFQHTAILSYYIHNMDHYDICVVTPTNLKTYIPDSHIPKVFGSSWAYDIRHYVSIALCLLHRYGGVCVPLHSFCMRPLPVLHGVTDTDKDHVKKYFPIIAYDNALPQQNTSHLILSKGILETPNSEAALSYVYKHMRRIPQPIIQHISWEQCVSPPEQNNYFVKGYVVSVPYTMPPYAYQWVLHMKLPELVDTDTCLQEFIYYTLYNISLQHSMDDTIQTTKHKRFLLESPVNQI